MHLVTKTLNDWLKKFTLSSQSFGLTDAFYPKKYNLNRDANNLQKWLIFLVTVR